MRASLYECSICGRIWKRETERLKQRKTCSKKCASIKGYLSGDRKETGIELKLQSLLLALDIEFETQKPILGVTIADVFILPNVAIFADGTYWHGDPMTQYKDAEKTKRLRSAGYVVLRLDEEEIEEDTELVKSKLLEAYNCRRITKKL
jgi:very-short-patch-repair endonuclease